MDNAGTENQIPEKTMPMSFMGILQVKKRVAMLDADAPIDPIGANWT